MTMKEIEIFEKMFRTFQKEIKNALSQIIKTFNDVRIHYIYIFYMNF